MDSVIPFDAPAFTITGSHIIRVVGLHDGDTINAVMMFNGRYNRFSLRLDGIDTPEMTSKDPAIKEKALAARQRLFNLITGNFSNTFEWKKKDFDSWFKQNDTIIRANINGLDKYGRLLAQLGGNRPFADILVNEGLANRYDGGTKQQFS